MRVRDLMSKSVVTIAPEESAALAARLLSRHELGALPVCAADGTLVGIVTDRDIVLRLIDKIGPDRLIFGTDFPMWSPKEELARFLSLGLDESSRQKILYKNFMKLLKLHDEDEESTKRGDAHVSDRH